MPNKTSSPSNRSARAKLSTNSRPAKLLRATPALKKAFANMQAEIRRLRKLGSSSFDELWEIVDGALRAEPPLWLGGGYRSKKEFIAKELPGESERSVARNCMIARCFSAADEARHGISFLEEAALYAQSLASAAVPPAAIDLDRLKLTVRKKGVARRKSVREATILELRQARRALRGNTATRRNVSPREQAMRKALFGNSALKGVGVHEVKSQWTFSAVPAEALSAFGRAVSAAKLPLDK